MRFKIVVGDWSNDGHGRAEDVIIDSNKDTKEILAAYKKASKKCGVALEHSYDKAVIGCLCDYEDNSIPKEAVDRLNAIGINVDSEDYSEDMAHDDGSIGICVVGAAKLFLDMAKTELKDFEYSIVEQDLKRIDISIGYGLFYG